MISCTYADAQNQTVIFDWGDGRPTQTAPVDWPGRFRTAEDEGGVVGFLAHGGTIGAYVAPPTPIPDPTPLIYAIGQLQVADGSLSALSISSRIAGAFQLSTGSFYVFFTDTQPDTSYLALAYDTGGVRAFVQEADKATDHFVISTTDATGTPADPTVVNFEIKRVS